MSAHEIDTYLEGVSEPQRSTLEALRRQILALVPHAEQCISYKIPAFRVEGAVIAGFAAFKGHMSYLPFSGSTLHDVRHSLKDFDHTKSALHFTSDHPLPTELVTLLIRQRLDEMRERGR